MAEMSVTILMLIPILLPFVAALVIFGFKKWLKSFAAELGAGVLIAIVALIAALNYRIMNSSTKILYGVYNTSVGNEYGPPIGVQFRADGFSTWFMLLINIIIIFVFIFESAKQREKPEAPIYVSIILFLVAGINGVSLSYDFLTMILSWVIIGVSLISLISFKRQTENLKEGGVRSFILIGLSIALLLLAVVLCYGVFGTLNFDTIRNDDAIMSSSRIQNIPFVIYTIIALVVIGFGIFANVFLLNLWMPKTIQKTSGTTQFFMMGITSSLALVSMFRVLLSFFNPENYDMANYPMLLAIFGLLTAFEGALLLIYQVTKKESENISLTKIIIFSAFANIGIILTCLSLGSMSIESSQESLLSIKECMGYSMLQMINLALSMFLSFTAKDRIVEKRNMSDSLPDLKGIAREYPLTTFILIISIFSTIGLLPTFGGVNLYMLLLSLIKLDCLFFAIALIVIVIMMLFGYLLVFKYILFGKSTRDVSLTEGGLSRDLSLQTFFGTLLALCLIVFGLLPFIIDNQIVEYIDLFFS